MTRCNTFVLVFLPHAYAWEPILFGVSLQDVQSSLLALYHRAAQHGIKKIQYLCERDLAAFREFVTDEDYAGSSRSPSLESGALTSVYICTLQPDMWLPPRRYMEMLLLSSVRHVYDVLLERSSITMKQRDFRPGISPPHYARARSNIPIGGLKSARRWLPAHPCRRNWD